MTSATANRYARLRCAEESRDAVVLETVSTVEALCSGLSRQIWQKIGILGATA